VQILADQRKESAVAFLEAAVAYFAKLDVGIEHVMTDNGSCYRSKIFRAACKRLSNQIAPRILKQMESQRVGSRKTLANIRPFLSECVSTLTVPLGEGRRSDVGRVSRASPIQTAMRNCTRDEELASTMAQHRPEPSHPDQLARSQPHSRRRAALASKRCSADGAKTGFRPQAAGAA